MLPKLLSAKALYQRLQHPGNLLMLDVRNEEEFAQSRIETRHTPETLNIPYMMFIEDDTRHEVIGRLPRNRPIVVVCAHGGSSEYVAGILRHHGFTVANMAGGMESWAGLHVVRPVAQNEWVEIYQLDRPSRGCLSYVLISGGWAAVIDPSHYIHEYQSLIAGRGAMLRLIIDTHAHADHISGGPALAGATGAPYYLHPYDAIHPFDVTPAAVVYETLRDGHRFRLGSVVLRALHAPGHTLGHMALLATTLDGQPYLFSGDTLLLRSIGRPDLGGQVEAWVRLTYETIFGTLRAAAPAHAPLLPGHYADPAEANARGLFMAAFGDLWHNNADLAFTDPDAFVRHVLASLPATPPEYANIKRVNMGLARADAQQALQMETGRNVCALTTAYHQSGLPVPG